MRFLKRLFSICSKKSKKQSTVDPGSECVQEYLRPDDTEAAVSRLLRSSSGRCATEPQTGLGALPPLPHPIDSVVPPPKSSSATIGSVSARSTYSVTIHGRTVHSRTVFPNAYPPMDTSFTPKRSDSPRRRSKSVPITPRDKSRLLALRQDPSVASLLNHYDNHGHLNSALFSNTPSPQKESCVQTRPRASTLRQLLGHPTLSDLENNDMEGHISWAEKFLGETDANSSVSSIGPRTPADTYFAHTLSFNDKTAIPIECDASADHPTFSSLEVELSASADLTHPQVLDPSFGNSISPQRASQVFGFLSDKKRAHDSPASRLPQLKTTPHYRRFSAESSLSDTKHPVIRRCNTYIPQPTSPISQRRRSIASGGNRSPPSAAAPAFLSSQREDQEAAYLKPLVTQYAGQSCRGSREPRPPPRIPSRQSTSPMSDLCDVEDSSLAVQSAKLPIQSVFGEKSNTENSHVAARPREMPSQIPKLRSASGSSNSSAESRRESNVHSLRRQAVPLQPTPAKPRLTELAAGAALHGKENEALSHLPQPVTPVRPFSLRAQYLFEPPSPVSSSELSPVGKQMMANLRTQRMQARRQERHAGRLGSGQSRIRH